MSVTVWDSYCKPMRHQARVTDYLYNCLSVVVVGSNISCFYLLQYET